jgi:integrase
VYPTVGLKRAREKREAARALLADGVDPKRRRQTERLSQALTLELIGREWLALQQHKLAAVTLSKARWMLESFIFPSLGRHPIGTITPPDLLMELRKIEATGAHETAMRTKQRVGQIYRYAIATGRAERDITADLRGALAPGVTVNRAALTDPAKVAGLLRAIDGYQGDPVTCAALKLAPLVFVRPGELRAAEWDELDLEAAEWRIPGTKMKMREPHLVPLSTQAVAILRGLAPLTGNGRYLFPSLRTRERPMSNNTLNAALRRLGYSGEEMTSHGFRTTASTLLNEQGFPPDVIELQLAHKERNKVRAAYNRAQRLEERRKMMQAWADYLDGLRSGGNVTPFRRTA